MAVSAFQDYPLADRDREWDGAAAEKRIRAWAGAEDEPEHEIPGCARLVRQREQGQFHRVQAADRGRHPGEGLRGPPGHHGRGKRDAGLPGRG